MLGFNEKFDIVKIMKVKKGNKLSEVFLVLYHQLQR
jgi:hypothetical protein